MPCMCGDTCCPSCGPAQGNWKCPICGVWASEGCEHISQRTGKLKKKFEAEAARIEQAEREEENKMFEEWERLERESSL